MLPLRKQTKPTKRKPTPKQILGFVPGGSEAGSLWHVRIGHLVSVARYDAAAAATRDRFGAQGLRVLQLLVQRGQLEQKQVAELTLGPPKETRELLYKMLRAGYVEAQLVPRAADRAPSRAFFTWRADPETLYRRTAGARLGSALQLFGGAFFGAFSAPLLLFAARHAAHPRCRRLQREACPCLWCRLLLSPLLPSLNPCFIPHHTTPHHATADIYKAACNVSLRYAAVRAQNRELIAATRAAYYTGASINLTEDAKPRMTKLHAVNQALSAALLRLDEQAALFADFADVQPPAWAVPDGPGGAR